MSAVEKKREATEFNALRSRGASRGLLYVLMLTLVLIPRTALAQDPTGEYELKAAMLFNLTRFVEWPDAAYADAQAPTVLCILGRDPFGGSLTSLASRHNAGGRSVQVRGTLNTNEIQGCHVLYVSTSERKNVAQILASLKGTSVLTVGEIGQFAARGGMIQFSLEEKQVHFEINLEAASEADLKISSRLLLLARIVKDQNRNPKKEGSALWLPVTFEVTRAWKRDSGGAIDLALLKTPILNSVGSR